MQYDEVMNEQLSTGTAKREDVSLFKLCYF